MLLVKATAVLALATLAGMMLRRSSAASRHRLWSVTFAALLALPLLVATMPELALPVSSAVSSALDVTIRFNEIPSTSSVLSASDTISTQPVPASTRATGASLVPRVTTSGLLVIAWLGGTLLSLTALVLSVCRVQWLAHAATEVDDPAWTSAAAATAARLSLRRGVRLAVSSCVTTPMAAGILRPIVFLPPSARAWDAEQRDVVLAHELAHLAARDPQRHALARLAVSLYWFHPLAWFAAREATAAREAACDERVLALGTRPSAYARVLVDLAASMQSPPRTLVALPMVHKSSLEVRVMAILNGSTHRPSIGGAVALLAVTVGTLVIAAAAPGAAPQQHLVSGAVDTPTVPVFDTSELAALTDAFAQAAAHVKTGRREECSSRGDGESFSGRIDMTDRNVIYEQAGTLNRTNRIVMFPLDGIRLCMYGENVGNESNTLPSTWLAKGDRVIMESTTRTASQRLTVDRGNQPVWQVNGATRQIDPAANEWRARMLAAFDAYWELTTVNGQVTSLRGQITSLRGQETSLRGEITSLRGEVTSMRGRITSIRGEETSMRGRITSIRGQETALRGQITSAQGTITSINYSGANPSDAQRRISEAVRQIELAEKEIRDFNADAKIAAIEKEIERFNADRQAQAIEREIAAFDLDRKVSEVERRIAELKVEEKEREIERQIDSIDVEKRTAEIQKRIDAEKPRLRAAIAAVR